MTTPPYLFTVRGQKTLVLFSHGAHPQIVEQSPINTSSTTTADRKVLSNSWTETYQLKML